MRNNAYILRHKNYDVALILFNEDGEVVNASIIDPARVPFQNTDDGRFVGFWWSERAIPEGRFRLVDLLEKEGCSSPSEFLIKNLGLSLTDSYWVCPIEYRDLRFEDVNLYDNGGATVGFHEADGRIHYTGSPNAALGGTLDKTAIKKEEKWFIKKRFNTKYADAQQNANELFVSELNKRLGWKEHVTYTVEKDDQNRCANSLCEYFTCKDRELISAFDLTNSLIKGKQQDAKKDLNDYISKCVSGGLDREYVRTSLDYMISLDYIITNSDRHWNNFGVLRDPETLKLVSLAPLFDHGNSMFFDSPYVLKRHNIAALEGVGLTRFESDRLSLVENKNIIKTDLLPSPDEVMAFYSEYGIPEERAYQIAESYSNKLDMYIEFRKGFTISLARKLEMLDGVTPYFKQKPNPEYNKKHPDIV